MKIVVATNPDAKNAYLILADCYLQTGQDRDAVTLLQPREAMFQDDLASHTYSGPRWFEPARSVRASSTSTASSRRATPPKDTS